GVGQADRFLLGATLGGSEANIATNDVDPIVDLFELPKPVVAKAPTHAAEKAAGADAPRDRDHDNKIAIKVTAGQFAIKPSSFMVQLDQAVDFLRLFHHVGIRRILGSLGLSCWRGGRRG